MTRVSASTFARTAAALGGDYSVSGAALIDDPQIIEMPGGSMEILSRVLPDGAYRLGDRSD